MKFEIVASDELEFWPDMNCLGSRGSINLGGSVEALVLPVLYWSVEDYRRHWRSAIAYLLESRQATCLITEIFGTEHDDMIRWWLLYPNGANIIVHQQLTDLSSLAPALDPRVPWRSIPPLEKHDEGEPRPSEWSLDWADLETWLSAPA